ncbi:Thiol-specific monooxygenase [Meyerozyma sp. JA9]|nr:Thiol-specific monooxygenase [Meyerozyma sp. JA9]
MAIRKVGIIGGGPAGAAAAKALSLEPSKFAEIHLFEKKPQLGGLWNYSEEYKAEAKYEINGGGIEEEPLRSSSPMYRHLETNITKWTMKYKDFPMPESYPTFPSRAQIASYVRDYSKTIEGVTMHLGCGVESLEKSGESWKLTTEQGTSFSFDAVVVASGHFDKPYIPQTPGILDWVNVHPGEVTHAKYYNDSTNFRDKTVLVVGGSASGIDIAMQAATQAKTVLNTTRSESKSLDPVISIPEVVHYDPENRQVTCLDGQKYDGIDSIVFCTGYLYELPFLKSYKDDLITTGKFVNNLYRHIFYIKDPTLAFLAIPKNVIPMPFSESQGAVVARVFAGRIQLPSLANMETTLPEPAEGMHILTFPKDVEYCQELQAWIDESGTKEGFEAEEWTDERTNARGLTPTIKARRLVDVQAHVKELRQKREPYSLLDSPSSTYI